MNLRLTKIMCLIVFIYVSVCYCTGLKGVEWDIALGLIKWFFLLGLCSMFYLIGLWFYLKYVKK